jgi:hypothetical protein
MDTILRELHDLLEQGWEVRLYQGGLGTMMASGKPPDEATALRVTNDMIAHADPEVPYDIAKMLGVDEDGELNGEGTTAAQAIAAFVDKANGRWPTVYGT